jgi:hypothetical protein
MFGAPPAVTSVGGIELAIVAATATKLATDNNLYAFQESSGCKQVTNTLIAGETLTGASANNGTIFVSNGHGFSSIDFTGGAFGSAVPYGGASPPALPTLAAPSLCTPGGVNCASIGTIGAIFASASPDRKVRRAVKTTCLAPACWQTDTGYIAVQATSGLSFTPIFDGTTIWTADDQGVVYAWSKVDGSAVSPPKDLLGPATSPVLMQDGSLLVVQADGSVKMISASGAALTLVNVGTFTSTPVVPAIDRRDPGGVAYVPAPGGWVWAVHVPAAPALASGSVWPRPGRDSCNSRSAGSPCQ